MLNRTVPPPFRTSTAFDLIQPEESKLSSGVPIYFIHGGDQEVIRVEIVFPAGRWYEAQPGVAHFTGSLLNKGTATKNSFQIAQGFDQYGAHIEVSAGLDVVTVSLYSLVKHLSPVLDLFREVLSKPTFPEKELKQSKSIFLQNLKVNQEKTSFIASSLIRQRIFGATNPYGSELEENDVAPINTTQLLAHFTNFYKASHIFVAGKIDSNAKTIITSVMDALPLATESAPDHTVHAPIVEPLYVVKEGSLQSSLRLAKKAVDRNHTDYFELLLLNHLFGGFFGSRLMKNIREEKGLSYGIYSALHVLMHDSYLVIGADVGNENRQLAIDEIRNEIRKLSDEAVGQDELKTAQLHFIGSLQSELATPMAHGDKIKNIVLNHLPNTYYFDMIRRMNEATPNSLRAIAQKYLSEKDFAEVAVG